MSISLSGGACSDTSLSHAPEREPESIYSDGPTLPSPVLHIPSSEVRGCISDIIESLDPDISCPPPLVSDPEEEVQPILISEIGSEEIDPEEEIPTAEESYDACSLLIPEIRTALTLEMLALFAPYVTGETEEEILETEIPMTLVVRNEGDTFTQVVIPGFVDHPDFRESPFDYLDENGIGFSKLQAIFGLNNSIITDFMVQPNSDEDEDGSVEPVEFGTDSFDAEGLLSHDFNNAGSAATTDFDEVTSNLATASFFHAEAANCIRDFVQLVGPGIYQIAVE